MASAGTSGAPAAKVERFVCGPLENNVYLVSHPATGEALAVDPGIGAAATLEAALQQRHLKLIGIVATHSHWDHVAGLAALASATGAPVLAHRQDAAGLARPTRPALFPDLAVTPVQVSRQLVDGDVIPFGDATFEVLHTPGHTPGSICLYWAAGGVLLSGDTLFAGSYGRYDLPGGDPQRLRASLERLAALPPSTRVYPGHGALTTIGAETWLTHIPL